MNPYPFSEFTRRRLLKGIAAAGALSLLPRARPSEKDGRPGRAEILAYLARHRRADGGYAFVDQARSHLTPTFAVIACHRLLGADVPDKAAVAEFVRTHHPRELKKQMEQERRIFEFQQVQSLVWLGAGPGALRERIAAITEPMTYKKQYERHGYPIFQSELGLVQCHALLGLPLDRLRPAFPDYLLARRRPNGSFNNTPAADGGDGHVMNTWWGLQAAETLGEKPEKPEETVAWIRECQRPGGGFTYQPRPMFGGVDDVAYARAAVRALKLLGAEPADRAGCIDWLRALANADGGFGDRAGWASNPLATYYALDALDALGAMDVLDELTRRRAPAKAPIPEGLKVYSIQLEAHGTGSPIEAVALASALRIDLWGAKNPRAGWLEKARSVAMAERVPVTFFTADEEYGTWVNIPGLGTYSHTSDMVAPPTGDVGSSLAGADAVSWPEFRERRLAPLQQGGGRLIWQFGENEELVRMFLDDSVERGGFAAISTFHFGNPDFANTEPFLNRWRGRLPFVALQDAHGEEPWWFADMTTGFRTLFLAREPSWAGWLEALRLNRVVAVRHDEVSFGETWVHGGSDEVIEYVWKQAERWRWWDNPAVRRPLVSLVALRPDDGFEAGRPERGVNLRVRRAWKNATQGFPLKPLAELVRLTVDGTEVTPVAREMPRARGAGIGDAFHLLELPEIAKGGYVAAVTVKELATSRIETRTLEFFV